MARFLEDLSPTLGGTFGKRNKQKYLPKWCKKCPSNRKPSS
jgi:hypothetical protein